MAPLLHPAAPLNFEEASEGGRATDLLKFVSSSSSGQLGDDGRDGDYVEFQSLLHFSSSWETAISPVPPFLSVTFFRDRVANNGGILAELDRI